MKSDYSEGFERFWKLYPRKTAKHAAWLVWKKTVTPFIEKDVIDALQAQVAADMFSDDVKYVPHGRTWLNQRRWTDEVTQSSKAAFEAASSWKPRVLNCPKCHSVDRGHDDTCQHCDWTRDAWEAKRKQAKG